MKARLVVELLFSILIAVTALSAALISILLLLKTDRNQDTTEGN